MKPYMWMVDFTPQREWIAGRGLLLWLAFFCTELGAGAYLVSMFMGYTPGMIAGWLHCAVLGGGLHLAYLGRPERAWRAFMRPAKSELSRGLVFTLVFLLLGLILLTVGYLRPDAPRLVLQIITGACAVAVVIHGFMVLNTMSSLPFWSVVAGPMLATVSGVWTGMQLVILVALAGRAGSVITLAESAAPWLAAVYGLMVFYSLWSAKHGAPASRAAVKALVRGPLAAPFYLGVIVLGLAIPSLITYATYLGQGSPSAPWLVVRALSLLAGDLTLRFLVHKAAAYHPLIDSNVLSLRLSQEP